MCVQDYSHHNLTQKLQESNFKGKVREYKNDESVSLPETVDWRTGGAVTWVKDQVIVQNLYKITPIHKMVYTLFMNRSKCSMQLLLIFATCS